MTPKQLSNDLVALVNDSIERGVGPDEAANVMLAALFRLLADYHGSEVTAMNDLCGGVHCIARRTEGRMMQ